MGRARRITGLAGLLFVLAATFLPISKLGQTYLGKPWGGELFWWGLAAAVLLYVVVVERLPLSSIGFRKPKAWDIVLGVVAGVLAFIGIGVVYAVVFPMLHLKANTGAATTLFALPFGLRLAMVTRAAVVEEIIFRGFGIERLKSLTGSSLIAGVLTLAAFTYAHLAGTGAAHLIAAGSAGLIITLLYLWRRNIWAVIIAHWVTDAAGLLLLPLLQH